MHSVLYRNDFIYHHFSQNIQPNSLAAAIMLWNAASAIHHTTWLVNTMDMLPYLPKASDTNEFFFDCSYLTIYLSPQTYTHRFDHGSWWFLPCSFHPCSVPHPKPTFHILLLSGFISIVRYTTGLKLYSNLNFMGSHPPYLHTSHLTNSICQLDSSQCYIDSVWPVEYDIYPGLSGASIPAISCPLSSQK